MMQMVGAFAEFERAMLRERTQAALMPPVSKAAWGTPPQDLPATAIPRFARWFRKEIRPESMPPVSKAASGDAAPSSPPNSNPRFERWFRKEIRPPPLLPASSRSTQPPSRGCSSESPLDSFENHVTWVIRRQAGRCRVSPRPRHGWRRRRTSGDAAHGSKETCPIPFFEYWGFSKSPHISTNRSLNPPGVSGFSGFCPGASLRLRGSVFSLTLFFASSSLLFYSTPWRNRS